MRSFQSGLSTTYLELNAGYNQTHLRTDSKALSFTENPPEETDQTTVLYFLEDMKKLKDSLCL